MPSTPWEQLKFGFFFCLGAIPALFVARVISMAFSHAGFPL
jgi:hypothetical protein